MRPTETPAARISPFAAQLALTLTLLIGVALAIKLADVLLLIFGAILVGVLMWILVNRTAFGVLSSLAGRNPIMVVWQGARLSRLGIAGFVLGGALAGLAGTIEVLGPNGRLVSGFLPAHGFTAILIALVASLSITGTGIVALFFGGLAAASLYLPVLAGLPAAAIDIINAAIALFITARTVPGLARLARLNEGVLGLAELALVLVVHRPLEPDGCLLGRHRALRPGEGRLELEGLHSGLDALIQ